MTEWANLAFEIVRVWAVILLLVIGFNYIKGDR